MGLNNINQTIGENMRFVRDYQANPEKYASASSASSSASSANPMDSMMQMLNPMLLMMLFQMMSRMMTQMGAGLPTYNPTMLPMAFSTPMPSVYPAATPLAGTTTAATDTSSTSTTGASTPTTVASTAAATSTSSTTTTATDTSTTSIGQNPAVGYLEGLFQEKSAAVADGEPISLTEEDIAGVWDSLTQGQITNTQLGQALMYELDKAPDAHMQAVGDLIANMTYSGDLNITPFLQNDYMARLTPERQSTLIGAVEQAGLESNGKPNARFIAFILDNLARYQGTPEEQPYTQAFLRQFLQDQYTAYGQDTTTPAGQNLASVLSLAGITADEQQQLVF